MFAAAVLHADSVVPMTSRWLKAIGGRTVALGMQTHIRYRRMHPNAVYAAVPVGTVAVSCRPAQIKGGDVQRVVGWSTSPPTRIMPNSTAKPKTIQSQQVPGNHRRNGMRGR